MLERFTPRLLGPKAWGTELLIAHTPSYIGKVLSMRAGEGGPLQYHEQKDETFFLYSGKAQVTSSESGVAYLTTLMLPGESFHVPPWTIHQVTALDDCVFFEVSTPHFDDRVAVERES